MNLHHPNKYDVQKIVRMTKMFTDPLSRCLERGFNAVNNNAPFIINRTTAAGKCFRNKLV